MSGAKATTYSEWARERESISSVEIALENMCEGENSRDTTEYGIIMCAKRILERGWIQTSPFVWKWKTQEDADRFCFLISSKQEIAIFFQNQKVNFASGLGTPSASTHLKFLLHVLAMMRPLQWNFARSLNRIWRKLWGVNSR